MVNPFVSAINPVATSVLQQAALQAQKATLSDGSTTNVNVGMPNFTIGKKISMKITTLNNEKQKINDALGNPIIIGIMVIWQVRNPEKAVFNVDNYLEYLSTHADSSLRNIVRLYPYDSTEEEDEMSLRGSSEEVALRIRNELQ
ncbi:SPFH domain-containing protein, partial [Bacillus licheniformis]